ncbi:MAG TPA: TIGR01458 family HAD-type hydrolase [Methanocorpusculum sp.]|nr:TIGR01458 family HAD-type hydrolase [Methanocorpusculum sp.]
MTVSGFLIDLDGVVYINGEPIPGAVPALQELKRRGIPFRFVSNNTHRSRETIQARLARFGVDIPVEWIFTPLTAAIAYLRQAGATSCWLLGSPDAAKELTDAGINPADPNASHVLIGDLSDVLGYEMFVAGFRVLMRNHAELLALEHDRYFKGSDGLLLSAGAFVAALEFAADTSAKLLGKPSAAFFQAALSSLGLPPAEVVMIGDDPRSDIGGAATVSVRGVLVLTGKFDGVLPDGVVAPWKILPGLADALDLTQ